MTTDILRHISATSGERVWSDRQGRAKNDGYKTVTFPFPSSIDSGRSAHKKRCPECMALRVLHREGLVSKGSHNKDL